jgi:7,8-dihydroneopterin aldolase/epimerase/oxygenase
MRDRIVLVGMAFEARHGVNDWEKTQAQRFEVDVELILGTRRAGTSDELAQTVDYRAVYEAVRRVIEGPPVDLIETVAESIARDVLAANRRARKVIVRVRKPDVQLGGPLAYAGVEVVRRSQARQGMPG